MQLDTLFKNDTFVVMFRQLIQTYTEYVLIGVGGESEEPDVSECFLGTSINRLLVWEDLNDLLSGCAKLKLIK
jgi:hypothetical protein